MLKKIKNFFVPTLQNQLKPYVLHYKTVFSLLALAIIIEGGFLSYVSVVSDSHSMLAEALSGIQVKVTDMMPDVLVSQTNSFRQTKGLGALAMNTTLNEAAKMKADDMAAKGYFSHQTPDGTMPWSWFEKAQYSYSYAGENLAVNFFDASDVTRAWENSPTHRENLLNDKYTQIGIGIAKGRLNNHDTMFVVQFFGTPADGQTPVQTASNSGVQTATSDMMTTRLAATGATITPASSTASSGRVLGISTDVPYIAPTGLTYWLTTFPKVLIASPRHTAFYILVILFCLLLLALIIPSIIIVKNHQSPNLWVRIREIFILFRSQIYRVIFVGLFILAILIVNLMIFNDRPKVLGEVAQHSVISDIIGL